MVCAAHMGLGVIPLTLQEKRTERVSKTGTKKRFWLELLVLQALLLPVKVGVADIGIKLSGRKRSARLLMPKLIESSSNGVNQRPKFASSIGIECTSLEAIL